MTKKDGDMDISAESINAIKKNFPSERLDDDTIIRFLIARNCDVKKTTDMIRNYLEFRKINNVASIKPPNGVDVPYTMSVRKLSKDANYDVDAVGISEKFKKFHSATGGMGVHGMDLQGRPILIEQLGKYNVKKMAELCDPEALKQLCILNNEFIFGAVLKECSRIHGRKIDKVFVN